MSMRGQEVYSKRGKMRIHMDLRSCQKLFNL